MCQGSVGPAPDKDEADTDPYTIATHVLAEITPAAVVAVVTVPAATVAADAADAWDAIVTASTPVTESQSFMVLRSATLGNSVSNHRLRVLLLSLLRLC